MPAGSEVTVVELDVVRKRGGIAATRLHGIMSLTTRQRSMQIPPFG
jgi:hypothetical protein